METTIIAALVPIIVAIGGGLAFIAYKHPRQYHELFWLLNCIGVFLFAGGLEWDYSRAEVYQAVLRAGVVTGDKIGQLDVVSNALSLPWWWFPAILGGFLYTSFLRMLADWIPDVKQRYQSQLDTKKVDKKLIPYQISIIFGR